MHAFPDTKPLGEVANGVDAAETSVTSEFCGMPWMTSALISAQSPHTVTRINV